MANEPLLILQAKGEEAYLITTAPLHITLKWATSVNLDLIAFYKAKNGEMGSFFSHHDQGNNSVKQFPFMQLQVDALSGEETLHIVKPNEFAEIYLCIVSNHHEDQFAFNLHQPQISVIDGSQKTTAITLATEQPGKIALIAKIDNNSLIGMKLINGSRVMDAATLQKTLPGGNSFTFKQSLTLDSIPKSESKQKLDSHPPIVAEKPTKFSFIQFFSRLLLNKIVFIFLIIGSVLAYSIHLANPLFSGEWTTFNCLLSLGKRCPGKTKDTVFAPEYTPIDKLYTAYAVVPLMDIHYKNPERYETPMGYCYREYEMSIGYNHINKELFVQYQGEACANNVNIMPEPNILSVDPKVGEIAGDYTQVDCDKRDLGELRNARVQNKLKESGQWRRLVESSQKTLMSYFKIYCPLK